jgi:hypothetical protein
MRTSERTATGFATPKFRRQWCPQPQKFQHAGTFEPVFRAVHECCACSHVVCVAYLVRMVRRGALGLVFALLVVVELHEFFHAAQGRRNECACSRAHFWPASAARDLEGNVRTHHPVLSIAPSRAGPACLDGGTFCGFARGSARGAQILRPATGHGRNEDMGLCAHQRACVHTQRRTAAWPSGGRPVWGLGDRCEAAELAERGRSPDGGCGRSSGVGCACPGCILLAQPSPTQHQIPQLPKTSNV